MSIVCQRDLSITINDAFTADFTYTITPCADGGSPYLLHLQSTWLTGYEYTWRVTEIIPPSHTITTLLYSTGATPSKDIVIHGGLNADVSLLITAKVWDLSHTGDGPTGEATSQQTIVIPHIDLQETYYLHSVSSLYGAFSGSITKISDHAWQGTLTNGGYPGPVTVTVYGDLQNPTRNGLELAMRAQLAPIDHIIDGEDKTGCQGNPEGTWPTPGLPGEVGEPYYPESAWGPEIIVNQTP